MTEYNPKNKYHIKKDHREFVEAMKRKFSQDEPVKPRPDVKYRDHITLIPYAEKRGGEE
jgi:hypothetical protein